MTDQIPESGAEVVNQESPTPKFTDPSPVSSPSGFDAKSLAKEVAAILKPDFERMAQSTKDKRIAKIEKELGLSELEEIGVQLSPEQKMELRLRQLEATRSAPVQEPPPGRGATSDSEQVSAVVKEAGLDANTPEVIALLSGQYRNLDHFAAEAYRLKTRLSNRPAPDASAAPAQTGGQARAGDTPESLEREYQAELKAIHRGDVVAISNLQAKYRKRGLNK